MKLADLHAMRALWALGFLVACGPEAAPQNETQETVISLRAEPQLEGDFAQVLDVGSLALNIERVELFDGENWLQLTPEDDGRILLPKGLDLRQRRLPAWVHVAPGSQGTSSLEALLRLRPEFQVQDPDIDPANLLTAGDDEEVQDPDSDPASCVQDPDSDPAKCKQMSYMKEWGESEEVSVSSDERAILEAELSEDGELGVRVQVPLQKVPRDFWEQMLKRNGLFQAHAAAR